MKIEKIILNNFKIYKGSNKIVFNDKKGKNISLIAGKNGFGKTTFLTSLIWGFYGGLMSQVEDKYRKDIKNVGGYKKYLKTLLNKSILEEFIKDSSKTASFQVEVHLIDVMIPSIPSKKVVLKRKYDYKKDLESLSIIIDGQENELTKVVGYDVFINDFILPREIAKFFFFDAEKIVSLAEAKSKSELKSLSKAYSEVLGIKKYEDLKVNLNTLLTKLRRKGVTKIEKTKLDQLIKKDDEYIELIKFNEQKKIDIEVEISNLKIKTNNIQEQLIREGNEITLEELLQLKEEKEAVYIQQKEAKAELKKLLEIVPIVIAGNRFKQLVNQVNLESEMQSRVLNSVLLKEELDNFAKSLLSEMKSVDLDKKAVSEIKKAINKLQNKSKKQEKNPIEILLDFNSEKTREILAVYNYIKDSFSVNFNLIIKKEKDHRIHLNRISKKIRQAEARKENPLAKELRHERQDLITKIEKLITDKEDILSKLAVLGVEKASNQKVLSEYEKNFKLVATDKLKYEVTEKLLEKIKTLINRIKEEKKYSLQKSILLGLKKLMHKDDFISNVNVRIEGDIMDIDLLDKNNIIIDKDGLSKGEQQLYATALLKALVDESGIGFPVFIDSPLQKFDLEHSSNVIEQFYPTISDQVVLFPLLEKELSKNEYKQLKHHLNGVYLLENDVEGSTIKEYKTEELFKKFNEQNYVLTN